MPMTKPATQDSARKPAILAVSGNQVDLSMLLCLFGGSSWELCTAGSVAAAGDWLRRNPASVVFCDSRLPDGDWKDILRMAEGLEDPPKVVVTSRHADDPLWADALDLGAFECPARQGEVFGTLSSAWRNWNERRHRDHGIAVACRCYRLSNLTRPSPSRSTALGR